jgi:hypothetical protein
MIRTYSVLQQYERLPLRKGFQAARQHLDIVPRHLQGLPKR